MEVNQDPGWDDLQVGLPERGWRGERARTRVPAFRHHSTGQAFDFYQRARSATADLHVPFCHPFAGARDIESV